MGSTLKGALCPGPGGSRLISAMGGNELTAYGLCHLGDYEATIFSEHSHNRNFGELFAKAKFNKMVRVLYCPRNSVARSTRWNCPYFGVRNIVRSADPRVLVVVYPEHTRSLGASRMKQVNH